MAAPLRFVIVQHQDDAPPGLLGEWAAAAGLRAEIVRPDRGEPLPEVAGTDLVAVLGSDEAAVTGEREWIDREARWVRDHVRASTPTLGICFGAQLLSVVLGGGRRPAPAPEIGWIEVRSADEYDVPPGPWFAWHADTIVAPPGGRVIARNRAGVQAYALGPHLGLQFHPEVTPAIIDGWAGVGGRDLASVGLARRTLAHQSADRADAASAAASQLFDRFLRRAQAFLRTSRGAAAA